MIVNVVGICAGSTARPPSSMKWWEVNAMMLCSIGCRDSRFFGNAIDLGASTWRPDIAPALVATPHVCLGSQCLQLHQVRQGRLSGVRLW